MNCIYSNNNIENNSTIFLAGPTERAPGITNWRKSAIQFFNNYEFNGNIYIPERNDNEDYDYIKQVEWERKALSLSTVIMFWIPRDNIILPGYTTNIEFGYWMAKCPNKCVYGRPENAEKIKYLDWLYKKETGKYPTTILSMLVWEAIKLVKEKEK